MRNYFSIKIEHRFNRFVFLISFLIFPFTSFSQFNPEPREITEDFFPDPKEWQISTPAFLKKDGFTTYDEMMRWLALRLKGKKEIASLEFIGESQKGKKIPVIFLTKENKKPKTKVWFQGGLHGDEPAGTEAMLYLLDRFLTDEDLAYLLESVQIAVVPMANIDGYEMQKRESADGTDLNRDQTRLLAKESIALKTAFSKFDPDVALDFHEYRPYRKNFSRFGRAGVTSRYDAMFLYSGNLNVPDSLRKFTKSAFVDPSKRMLDLNDQHFCHHDYFTPQKYGSQVQFNLGSVHARSSASSWALANTVAALIEIRGVGIGRNSFKRRVFCSWTIALAWLNGAYSRQIGIKKVLEESAGQRNPVVVLSERKIQKDTVKFIDLETKKEINLGITIHNALASTAVLERKRPHAYILSPTETRAANCLKILGLQLDTLSREQEIEVETYLSQKEKSQKKEGTEEVDEEEMLVNPAALDTRKITRKFPVGTFVVNLDQEKANLACEVLEPENANGFVEMKVIKPDQNQQIPIYRYLKSEKLTP